ncbi:MAG: RraA family protein [Candidatus Hodarchaeota archaeon]
MIKRPPQKVVDEYRKLYTDVVYDGLARIMGPSGGVCDPEIRPILDFMKGKVYVGPAITIKWAQRELLTLAEKRLRESGRTREDYQAIVDVAQPGDIIVSAGYGQKYGYWGDVLSNFAKAKGVEAIVIDGYTRDRANNERLEFPIFARGSTPLAEAFVMETIDMNVPVQIGSVEVCPGDLVMGDDDGVLIIPQRHIEETLKYALEKRSYEEKMIADARAGKSLIESMKDIYFELHVYKTE